MNEKKPQIYNCENCYFITRNKKDYSRHLLTRKHNDLHAKTNFPDCSGLDFTPASPLEPTHYKCQYCNRSFRSRTTIYQHKAKCILRTQQSQQSQQSQHSQEYQEYPDMNYVVDTHDNMKTEFDNSDNIMCVDNTITITKDMFMALLKDNQEMMKMLKSLSEQPPAAVNNMTITTNSNNTNSNNNNSTFNMNFFLNEKCKDAMNMKDFVNSIQLNLTDLENVGRLGYVEGMSNIFIDNLQKTDVYKRPVHCSDSKRETLYVKEDNRWEREGPDHAKMTNAVLAVEQKNVALVNEWAKANPRCMNSNTRENETYFQLSKVVTDGEKDGNIHKVIRKVAKQVAIEKEPV